MSRFLHPGIDAGKLLPYTIDFSTLPDGALPGKWTGATWLISGGVAVNTPTLTGSELVTDGDMEAVGVASWVDNGTPTTKEKSGVQVHAGAQSLHIITDATNEGAKQSINGGVALSANTWYQAAAYIYAVGAESCKFQSGIGGANHTIGKTAAAVWLLCREMVLEITGGVVRAIIFNSNTAGGSEFYGDDATAKAVVTSTLFASINGGEAGATVKAGINLDTGIVGVISHLDSASNPQNFMVAWVYHDTELVNCSFAKCVNGNYTSLFAAQFITTYAAWVDGQTFEIRAEGANQFSVYYNNVQVGTTQTVSDAMIIGNKRYGLVGSGGSAPTNFFCGMTTPYALGFAGSSITEPATSYAYGIKSWLLQNHMRYNLAFTNTGKSGHAIWSMLVRLSDLLAANPDYIIFENRMPDDLARYAFEAFIRRIWTALPACKLIFLAVWGITDKDIDDSINTVPDQADMDEAVADLAVYGMGYIDWMAEIRDLVNNQGHHLNEYYADTIHPTVLGQQIAAQLIEAQLPTGGWAKPASLPARIYADTANYENTPVRVLGTDYDAKTGTWAEIGTRIESNEVDATVTYHTTCQSFGCWRADSGDVANDVTVSIDGGAFQALMFYHNGIEVPAGRGDHTFVIKVVSGTVRIDEFWAI